MSMKLLLRKDVPSLGKAGEVVTVRDGYGRNYLLPRRFAVELNAANQQRIEAETKRREAKLSALLEDYRKVAARIEAVDITLKERVSGGDQLYGAVTPKEVVEALSAEGITIELSQVEMPEPIKALGVHRVAIRLHPKVAAELKIWVVELKDPEAGRQVLQ